MSAIDRQFKEQLPSSAMQLEENILQKGVTGV
jgi:hypothetical protein